MVSTEHIEHRTSLVETFQIEGGICDAPAELNAFWHLSRGFARFARCTPGFHISAFQAWADETIFSTESTAALRTNSDVTG